MEASDGVAQEVCECAYLLLAGGASCQAVKAVVICVTLHVPF